MTKCQNCFQNPRNLHFQFNNCIPNPDLGVIKIKSLFHPHFCQPTLIHLSLKCSCFCFLAMKLKMKTQATESDTPNYILCFQPVFLSPGCVLELLWELKNPDMQAPPYTNEITIFGDRTQALIFPKTSQAMTRCICISELGISDESFVFLSLSLIFCRWR